MTRGRFSCHTDATSTQIAAYTTTAGDHSVTYAYTYDKSGNILTISDGTYTTSYAYDSAGQLIRENNEAGDYTHTWTYNNAGNLLQRREYDYTTDDLDENGGTEVAYEYPTVTDPENNTVWGDKLTSYDGQEIAYDPIGNPLSISNAESGYSRTYTWEHGRQLKSLTEGNTTWNYTYNVGGMRTGRTDGTTTYQYIYSGSQLAQMKVGSNTLNFTYDAAGVPLTVTYNGTKYYYTTNIQGDVVAILGSSGTQVASYTYDAWGNCLTTPTSGVGLHNPLRYRGYVYDSETELYYLQSRYYNPEVGRFVNADAFIATGQGFIGNNMFAYCGNNPVSRIDPSGQGFIEWLIELFKRLTSYGETEYGAAEEYTPSDSTEQNCLGYVTGRDEMCQLATGTTGSLTIEQATSMTIIKVILLGMFIRPLNSYDSPIFENEYRIALRVNDSDYHYMVQHSDGSWSHKPSICKSRLIDGDNPDVVSWDSVKIDLIQFWTEGVLEEEKIIPNFYTSRIQYFAIRRFGKR